MHTLTKDKTMWQTKCVEVNNQGQYYDRKHDKWVPVSRLGQHGWELVNVFYDVGESKRIAWLKRMRGDRNFIVPLITNWDEV